MVFIKVQSELTVATELLESPGAETEEIDTEAKKQRLMFGDVRRGLWCAPWFPQHETDSL